MMLGGEGGREEVVYKGAASRTPALEIRQIIGSEIFPMNPHVPLLDGWPVCWSVSWSVGLSVCHNIKIQ